jgi:AraC-like DNA-binding protein
VASRAARTTAVPSPLDFDSEWQRAADEAGDLRALSRNIVRTINGAAGGSGTTDVVRLGDDALVNIVNCVLPHLVRWQYRTDEPLVMLRASLACDVQFRYGGRAPLVFNRPELTLACVPKGMPLQVDIAGGTRQQGIITIFRAASFASRYGLRDEDLPAELRDALAGPAGTGRVASFPIDHRVAALIADTLDSRLHGELRVVQTAGRVAELVAYALDAMLRPPGTRAAALPRRRDVDLAHAALARLDRDYRHPPSFADLAREIGTSQNKLKAVFKEAYGITMADYCLERRVREAQQLLIEASLTIAQVAERVGYEHQSSFTAAFRGHVGMSPREYRKHRAPFSVEVPLKGTVKGSPAVGRIA